MRILIDLGHPAHFHLFKNVALELEKRGHQIFWATRNKDVVVRLLELHRSRYTILTTPRTGLLGFMGELAKHDYELYKMSKELDLDLMIGTSIFAAQVSKVTRAKSIILNEDDVAVGKVFAWLTYPFADTIVTPDVLRKNNLGKKHVKYSSYHELAYLHPNYFTPNPEVLRELGVEEGERYFVLRFVSLKASHDVGEAGLSLLMRRRLVNKLSEFGKVFVSTEGVLPPELREFKIAASPDRIHHLLYYATMFIGDSQTMTAEAAVLGTPAVRCNTFVGRISYLEELEHKYGLSYGFLPGEEERMFEKIEELLSTEGLETIWQERRRRMLKDKIDLTGWMVDFIENYPESFYRYQRRMDECMICCQSARISGSGLEKTSIKVSIRIN